MIGGRAGWEDPLRFDPALFGKSPRPTCAESGQLPRAVDSRTGGWGGFPDPVEGRPRRRRALALPDIPFGDPSLAIHQTCGGAPPTNYCQGLPNSVGSGAVMGYSGSTSIAAGDLTITCAGAIPNQFGLFYYGPGQISVPYGEGLRCVGAGGIGVFRLLPPQMSDGTGAYSLLLDYGVPPLGAPSAGQVVPGSTWNFQCWYRDPSGGPAGFNYSDGLSVEFCN